MKTIKTKIVAAGTKAVVAKKKTAKAVPAEKKVTKTSKEDVLKVHTPRQIEITELVELSKSGKLSNINPVYLQVINENTWDPYGRKTFTINAPFIMVNCVYVYSTFTYVNFMKCPKEEDWTKNHNVNFLYVGEYMNNNEKFILVDENHKDFDRVVEKFKELRLSGLWNELSHNFKIGSDPEIFAEDKNGQVVPAFLFLPSKETPKYTADGYNFNNWGGLPMYWDGFQAEFTTTAIECLGHHTDSVAAGMKGVYDAMKLIFPDARLSLKSVMDIPPQMLKDADEEHVNFGCMPSYNAYGLKVNMPPPRKVPFRSAGGHIHFGIGKTTKSKAEPIVKTLDAILGVACVSLFDGLDDPRRRTLYGLPGEYRLPPHGLEYRPLSNAWLSHPVVMNLVFDIARKAVIFSQSGFMPYWNASEEEVLKCIMESDAKLARKILKRNEAVFKQIILAAYKFANLYSQQQIIFDCFINGVSSFIKEPHNLDSNWLLQAGWHRHTGAESEPNVRRLVHRKMLNNKHLD